jgi:hypothetical protein
VITVVLAATFLSVLLLVTFDLDRPVRGLVRVPDTPLVNLRGRWNCRRLPTHPASRSEVRYRSATVCDALVSFPRASVVVSKTLALRAARGGRI